MTTLRVRELIAQLSTLDPEAWVYIRDQYGPAANQMYLRRVLSAGSEVARCVELVIEPRNPEEER